MDETAPREVRTAPRGRAANEQALGGGRGMRQALGAAGGPDSNVGRAVDRAEGSAEDEQGPRSRRCKGKAGQPGHGIPRGGRQKEKPRRGMRQARQFRGPAGQRNALWC